MPFVGRVRVSVRLGGSLQGARPRQTFALSALVAVAQLLAQCGQLLGSKLFVAFLQNCTLIVTELLCVRHSCEGLTSSSAVTGQEFSKRVC